MRLPAILAVFLLLPACDSGADTKKADAAKAAAAQEKEKAEKDASVAKRRAEREAEQKAGAEIEAKRTAEFARLCVLPDPLPKKSPSCEDVGEAHDAFVRRVGEPDAVAKWDAGGKDAAMPMTVVRCTQAASNKVAMCQKNALDGAGAEMLGFEKDLLQKCIEAFGKAGGKAGMVPPKPGR